MVNNPRLLHFDWSCFDHFNINDLVYRSSKGLSQRSAYYTKSFRDESTVCFVYGSTYRVPNVPIWNKMFQKRSLMTSRWIVIYFFLIFQENCKVRGICIFSVFIECYISKKRVGKGISGDEPKKKKGNKARKRRAG